MPIQNKELAEWWQVCGTGAFWHRLALMFCRTVVIIVVKELYSSPIGGDTMQYVFNVQLHPLAKFNFYLLIIIIFYSVNIFSIVCSLAAPTMSRHHSRKNVCV